MFSTTMASAKKGPRGDLPGLIPLVVALVVVVILAVASMVAVVVWWKYKEKTKMVEGPNGGALTYTNPTYSASNSDVNTDRKPFTWRRLHHDANHQVSAASRTNSECLLRTSLRGASGFAAPRR